MLVEEPLSREELHRRALELVDVERLEGPELCDAYLKAAKLVRYDNPQLMVDFAEQAVSLAASLDPQTHGAKEMADCRCLALGELGNAYRVADRHPEAGLTLGEALALWFEGSGDETLRARLYDYQASLFVAQRQFTEAFAALDVVHSIYTRLGEDHLAGRALISKGIYLGYQGNEEGAIELLRKGLAEIDPKRDPSLHFAVVQSQAYFLAVLERFREARMLLWGNCFPAEVIEARTNRLKLRWVEARIQAGLGDDRQAEEGLREVTRGFEKEKLYYKSALAGLELVRLWYRQGRKQEVLEAVTGLVEIFRSYKINRETLFALSLLKTALEEGVEAGAILDRVAEFVRRAETQSGILFRDWFP